MAKKIFAFIMAAVLACTALAGCTAQKDADTAKENITTTKKVTDDSNFKLSYTQADSLDPFKSKTQNNQVLSSLVFESLFDIDENWESVPNIATKYEFSDGKTLKVSFNPSLTFSDGSRQTVATGPGWKRQNANDFCNPVCWWHPALGMSRGTFGPGEQPEHLDGPRLPQNWERPGFDDSGWEAAAVTAVTGAQLGDGDFAALKERLTREGLL